MWRSPVLAFSSFPFANSNEEMGLASVLSISKRMHVLAFSFTQQIIASVLSQSLTFRGPAHVKVEGIVCVVRLFSQIGFVPHA